MKATLYGNSTRPSLVMSGSWDPVLPEHVELMDRLVRDAHNKSLDAVIVMFDPAPSSFVLRRTRPGSTWVTYNDADVNMRIFFQRGVDAVLIISFKEEYLDMGVAELFESITAHVEVAEFWFGSRQRFGNGPNGSQATLITFAREHNIRLRRLANLKLQERSYLVRSKLQEGHLTEAFDVARVPPIRARPEAGKLNLPWTPGTYAAIPLYDLPHQLILEPRACISVSLEAGGKEGAQLVWPNPQVEFLAFVAGPADGL
ncbi:MAG: hypothetical protein IT327_25015 [Anaerolineae bacterium]|nr:hypothetical protein [Anaerolineae bacterium]